MNIKKTMSNGEAKIKIKRILMAEIDRLPSHYDADIDEQVFTSTVEANKLLQLNKIVSEALEKQTTKYKHINTRYTHWGKCRHDKFRCETCGFTKEFTNNHTAQYQFCPGCGREINWSKPKGSDCDFMFIDEVIAYDTQKED